MVQVDEQPAPVAVAVQGRAHQRRGAEVERPDQLVEHRGAVAQLEADTGRGPDALNELALVGEVRAQDLVALAQAREGRAQALGVDLGAELHDERHVVPHRALVLALLDEEPPLLRRHRVARRRTAGRAGRRVVRGRSWRA